MLRFTFAKGSVHGHLAPCVWVEHHGGNTWWRGFVSHGRAETESRAGLRTRQGPSKVGGRCHQRQGGALPPNFTITTHRIRGVDRKMGGLFVSGPPTHSLSVPCRLGVGLQTSAHSICLTSSFSSAPFDARAQSHLGEVCVCWCWGAGPDYATASRWTAFLPLCKAQAHGR